MSDRIPVGVMGATGTVGERIVRLLHDHPWFELREVGASEGSQGEKLGSRVSTSELGSLPEQARELVLKSVNDRWDSPLLLSALPASAARELEPALASAGHLVVSNASAHRMVGDVPLVIPEVNPDHLGLLDGQKERWPGGIVTNPNCVVAGLAMALAPLERAFGIRRCVVTTFQAISGAGRPGPAAADLVDNVLPYIAGEEEKMGPEARKILGRLDGGRIVDAELVLSATATRVPVLHGHLAAVSVELGGAVEPADAVEAFRTFRGTAPEGLPLAPERPVVVLDGDDRPQPGIDREEGRGMAVTVGRIRRCDVHHVKFMVLSHNLIRGAAGAAVLNAELCRARGQVPSPGASGHPPAGAAGAADVAGSVGRPGGNGA